MRTYHKIKFGLVILSWVCLLLVADAAASGPREVIDIPVIVNVVDASDAGNVEDAIEKANEILGQAGIHLYVAETNNNVNVGDGDGDLTYNEGEQAVRDGQDELRDSLKDKDGNWNGKGIKITVADDCWSESGNTIGWCYHGIPVTVVEPDDDPNTMGGTIAHEVLHILTVSGHSNDPNNVMFPTNEGGTEIDPNDVNEVLPDGRKRGWPHWVVPVYPDRDTMLPPGIEWSIDGLGAILDAYFDVMCSDPEWFPDDPNYAYADLREISLFCDNPTEADSTAVLAVSLNGDFPADSFFDVYYEVPVDNNEDGIIDVTIRMFVDSPGGGIYNASAEYEDSDGYVYPLSAPEIRLNDRLDGEGGPIPGYHSLHLTFPIEVLEVEFFGPGSDPFDGIIYSVQSIANDGRLLVNPVLKDLPDRAVVFRLTNPLEIIEAGPNINFIGLSGGGGGRSVFVYGSGFPADSTVEVRLDGKMVGTTQADEEGFLISFPKWKQQDLEDGCRACMLTAKVPDVDDPNHVLYFHATGYFNYCSCGRIEGDLDNDCDVDFYDLSIVANNWLKICVVENYPPVLD